MTKTFIKDGIIRSFKVENNKVITTIQIYGLWISNPTLEMFYNEGWEDYIEPEIEQPIYLPTYAELVEDYIREHGYPTYGSELAVINNYSIDKETYQEEYNTYMSVRNQAKEWARTQGFRGENV